MNVLNLPMSSNPEIHRLNLVLDLVETEVGSRTSRGEAEAILLVSVTQDLLMITGLTRQLQVYRSE